MPEHTAGQIVAASRRFGDPTIGLLGLAFKPDVGDLRQSPAVEIAARVASALPDIKILAVKPHAPSLPGELGCCGNVMLTDAEHAVAESDVIGLLVDHSCFRSVKKTQLTGEGRLRHPRHVGLTAALALAPASRPDLPHHPGRNSSNGPTTRPLQQQWSIHVVCKGARLPCAVAAVRSGCRRNGGQRRRAAELPPHGGGHRRACHQLLHGLHIGRCDRLMGRPERAGLTGRLDQDLGGGLILPMAQALLARRLMALGCAAAAVRAAAFPCLPTGHDLQITC